MNTYAIHEPQLDILSVDRHRPTAGPAFEKRRWTSDDRILFVGTETLVIRPNLGARLSRTRLPARVTLWGVHASAVVEQMLLPIGGFHVSTPHKRFRPEESRAALESLLEDPDAAILAHERAGMAFYKVGLTGERMPEIENRPLSHSLEAELNYAASTNIEKFTRGVDAGQFLVCSVRSESWTLPGLALYGNASLYEQVNRAARKIGVSLTWTSVDAVRVAIDLGLPRWLELPINWHVDAIDASGFNFDTLPESNDATAIDLSNTAVVDLAPLRSWPNLRKANLANLRPLSLAPVLHLETLDVEASSLVPTTGGGSVRDLTIRGIVWPDLHRLRTWSSLTRLALLGIELGTLEGLDALGALKSLCLKFDTLPLDMRVLAALPDLEALCVHCNGEFDVRRLPELPRLRRLEIVSLNGEEVNLTCPESLARFSGLEKLVLTETNLSTLQFVADLPRLVHLGLDWTDLEELDMLVIPRKIRVLSLRGTYVTDLGPLEGLDTLEAFMFSTRSDTPPRLDVLATLGGLKRLNLTHDCVASLHWATSLLRLEQLFVMASGLSDLRPLAKHATLRKLVLACSEIFDITSLAELQLSSLSLAGTKVDNLEPLAAGRHLRDFHFFGGPIDITPLASMPLTQLHLNAARIENLSVLANLPLESLNLSGSGIEHCPFLGAMPRLQELDVSLTQIRSLSPLAALRQLRTLSAWGVDELDSATPVLAMPPLARLDLDARVVRPLARELETRHHVVVHGE